MPKFVKVARTSEIADQSATCVEVDGKPIAKLGRIPRVTNNPRLTQVL